MFRQSMLAITFVAALGVAGLVTPNTAEAWQWNRGGYYSYYYGPPRAYGYGMPYRVPYRAYYPDTYYYGPRPYYGTYYDGTPDNYYYRPVPRVAFRIGF